MSQAEIAALVEKGIAALKAGDQAGARQMLAEAVQQDPRNERGWVYLAALLPSAQAQQALERVLTLNPANQQAQRGLEALQRQSTQGAAVPPPPPAPVRTRKRIQKPAIEELPVTGDEPASRYTPSPKLVETMIPPKVNPIFYQQGSQPLGETVQDDQDIANDLPFEDEDQDPQLYTSADVNGPPLIDDPTLRNLLTAPYLRPTKRRGHPVLLALVIIVILAAAGTGAYFWLYPPTDTVQEAIATPAPTVEPTDTLAPVVSDLQVTPLPTDPPLAVITTVAATPTPTDIKLSIVQNQRAVLKAYAITFSGYENRSNNFSFAGAGTPKGGYHFEGMLVQLENINGQTLPVQLDNFQGIDGQNNTLKPMNGGRVPALDAVRLQPGEQQLGWLTFQVEDGTTLRRVAFNPTISLDQDDSADVNLTLPAATPAPTAKPTVKPTATPKPTSTPVPTATPVPTVTPAPTATPAPTVTPVVAQASPGAYIPTVDVPTTAAPVPATVTAVPTATPTVVPTTVPVITTVASDATPTVPTTPTPPATLAPTAQGTLSHKTLIDGFAITVTTYVITPTIKPPPLVLPTGYHYETVKLTLENLGGRDIADYIATMPFYLRDSNNSLYSVGPMTFEAADKFDPKVFAPTNTAPGKTKATGVLYFLVRDGVKAPRTLIFYSTADVDSPRVEITLK